MALSKIQSESINLADTFAFTGTVTGAGGNNKPAFQAYLSADQNVTNDANVKVQFNTEIYDTDSCYDNSTNYRFTPTESGKYLVYVFLNVQVAVEQLKRATAAIYKNGNIERWHSNYFTNNPAYVNTIGYTSVVDMNGSSDYVEAYVKIERASSGTTRVNGTDQGSMFGAYKIIE